jgi:GcrA cell cycle regulator
MSMINLEVRRFGTPTSPAAASNHYDWTEERIERLKTLWADGLTGSQIAHEMRDGLTRSAVIGKVHRLGLHKRVQKMRLDAATLTSSPRKRNSLRRSLIAYAGKERSKKNGHANRHGADLQAKRPLNGVTLLELEHGMCKWPCGDPGGPGFLFCGSDALDGFIYCAGHAHIAYDRLPARRQI